MEGLRLRRFNKVLSCLAVLSLLFTGTLLGKSMSASQILADGLPGSPHPGDGLRNEQVRREQNAQEDLKKYTDSSGRVRADLWQKAVEQVRHMKIAAGVPRRATGDLPNNGLTGVQWTQIGPAPLSIDAEQIYQGAGPDSGEVLDIAIDPRGTTDQVVYIAANDGGIWKSTDGGGSWKPKTDYMSSLSMGAVALDPSNPSVVYAGTGNLFDGSGLFTRGLGVYKSIDAGDTWTVLNPTTFSSPNGIFSGVGINRIVLPSSGVVLVASGSGLFRSVDGGQNFGNNAPLYNNGSPILGAFRRITDLKIDTSNSNTVFAAVSGQGIFQSTDGGATFPTNLFSNPGAPTGSLGMITFAQTTQPDNQTLFASVQGPTYGLFRSTDSGANWVSLPDAANRAAENNGCQCGYDQTIGVDPQNANQLYIGFQELYRSTNALAAAGSVSFGTPAISQNHIHWDHHAIAFSPATHWGGGGAPTRMYAGTDGGIHRSSDGAANWDNINSAIATNLFRAIDIGRGSAANNVYTYGGTQDTGTSEHRPGFSSTEWHLGVDGDGGRVAVDPNNPQRAYGVDDGGYMITTNGGSNWSFPGGTGLPGVFTLAVDPNNSANVYAGEGTNSGFGSGPRLYQSTDTGATFTLIHTFPASIQAIATASIDSNVIWVALTNGTVQRTANALSGTSSTWTGLTVTGAPGGRAAFAVAIDPTNTDQAVVVYPGFTNTAPGVRTKHVFRTTDNGTNWTDISGTDNGDPTQNLPDLGLNSVVIDPSTSPHSIIVGSIAGVMRTANNGATWQVLGVGLPTVDSTSLAIDNSVNPPLLRVGTYGRSVFELTSATGPLLAVNANLAFGIVPVGGNDTRIVQLFNVGSTDLHINSFNRLSGSLDFQVISGPPTPTTIAPGGELDYTVRLAPSSGGNKTATFQVNSDDPFQPAYPIAASGIGGVPTIVLSGDLNFGTVARGTVASRNLIVNNTGYAPLTVSSMFFQGGSDPEFSVFGPSTPQTIQPGSNLTFVIRFSPPSNSSGGSRSGTLRIGSNDPSNGVVTVPASGIVGVPLTRISSSALSFGSIAMDDRTIPNSSDQVLQITNQASCAGCDLTLSSLPIAGTNAADFSLVSPPSLPLVVGAGNSINITVRFNPSNSGLRTATLTVNSDDPATPSLPVSLNGVGLKPSITTSDDLLIFPPTVYDSLCGIQCGKTLNEGILDSGPVELILDVLSFTGSTAFSGPGPTVPLTRVQPGPGHAFQEPVTFHPVARADRKLTGNLHIQDNLGFGGVNPFVPADVALCGESVGRGIRVLVYDRDGNLVTTVDRLKLQSNGLTQPINIQERNLTLVTINPPTSCQSIQYHYENQALPEASKAGQRGSYYVLSIDVGNRHSVLSFNLEINEFKTIVAVVQ